MLANMSPDYFFLLPPTLIASVRESITIQLFHAVVFGLYKYHCTSQRKKYSHVRDTIVAIRGLH